MSNLTNLAPDLEVLLAIENFGPVPIYKDQKGQIITNNLGTKLPKQQEIKLIWQLHKQGLLNKTRSKAGIQHWHKTYASYSLSQTGWHLLRSLGL